MSQHQPRVARQTPIEVDRVKSFSDNIYAFSMTLLVTIIHLPSIPAETAGQQLVGTVLQEWRQFAVYAISFLNIGSYWILHHQIYASVERMDKLLVWLNLLLLLSVTFLPLPTAMLGKYGREPVTALFYGMTLAINYAMLFTILMYLFSHQNLLRPEIRLPRIKVLLVRCIIPLALIGTGAALAFVHTNLSFLLYFCVSLVNTLPWQSFNEPRAHSSVQ